ncbi:embigin [Plectropomus leopardus]|uniref:embigin n=1 Tax=Plectropomus leopardus TaxID=160734 RepID=UPI001C4B7AAF|nr:embigin [Plectropomus leopardus]
MQREDRGIIIMSASWKQLFLQILLLLVSCRHINTKTPGPTHSPLAPVSSLQTVHRSFAVKGENQTEKIELLDPVSLALSCIWTGNEIKLPNITGSWRKDGDEVENSRFTVQLENEQYNLTHVFSIVSEKDLGNYSCVFGNEAKIEFILAAPKISEVRGKPVVGYFGDFTVMTCKMEETKPKPKTWTWFKANGTDKEQIFATAEPDRYEIKNKVWETRLVVRNLTKTDGGVYYCGAVYTISTSMSHVELKVINFYEPLKPFIAIVIEVIVLVAAILLYERSQAKKNHTAENGTTEQTNTLTQGENNGPEEGSSMRQRKV